MATQLQLRRGTTQANDLFTGANGEVSVDTTTHGLRVHDGSTQGGYLVDTVVFFQRPTAENNYTWARKYASGWVEQGGTKGDNGIYNLPVTMANTNYTLTVSTDKYSDSAGTPVIVSYNRAVDSIGLQGRWNGSSTDGVTGWWRVEGMAA